MISPWFGVRVRVRALRGAVFFVLMFSPPQTDLPGPWNETPMFRRSDACVSFAFACPLCEGGRRHVCVSGPWVGYMRRTALLYSLFEP